MALNSVVFLLFLAVVATVYFVLPQKFQSVFLLAASYVFYFWTLPVFGLLMLLTTAVSYFIGKAIGGARNPRRRKMLLVLGILFCLSVLAVFKYAISAQTAELLGAWVAKTFGGGPVLPSYAAPLGIGFYTLQVIGYNVDVYRKDIDPERRFIDYALFVGFFAHITSGPIARADELLPQFKKRHTFRYDNLVEGCQRILTGAMKKVVVADGLAVLVDGVYKNLGAYSGWVLVAVSLLYPLQLYCDFSGYTDMALGAAKVLGFSLRENFRAPYLATSMNGVWQRWHMSLTSWLRNYVYIPLGGSRKGFGRKLFNIIAVYFVSGLWHGNGASYIVWGLFHGLFRVGEELWQVYGPKKKGKNGFFARGLKRAAVYVLWALSFITFKAETLPQLRYVLTHLFDGGSLSSAALQLLGLAQNGISATGVYYLIFFGGMAAGFLITAAFDRKMEKNPALYNPLSVYKTKPRWLLYWVMGLLTASFFLIALTGEMGSPSFIYNQY